MSPLVNQIWNLVKENKKSSLQELEERIKKNMPHMHVGAAIGYLRANHERIKRARKFKA